MDSSRLDDFARDWPAQKERWERFAAWEREELARAAPEFSAALAWMSQAWDLARRHDPSWGSDEQVIERCHRHAEVRRRLGFVRGTP